MEIRRGAPDDHAPAVEVYQRAQAALGQRQPAQRLARVAEKLRAELLFVAVEEDSVIAMAVAEPARHADGAGKLMPATLHLSMLFVAPDRQRQGVGTALLEGVADAAWADGYRTLLTWSGTPEFYQACGLERTRRHQVLSDGRTIVLLSAELEAPVRAITVGAEGIRLGQLLKFAGLVDTGAEAKQLLAAGSVSVNGEVDLRRGRQLTDGDEVRTQDQAVVVRQP